MPLAETTGMSKKNNVNPGQYKTAGRDHTDGSDRLAEAQQPNAQKVKQIAQPKKVAKKK